MRLKGNPCSSNQSGNESALNTEIQEFKERTEARFSNLISEKFNLTLQQKVLNYFGSSIYNILILSVKKIIKTNNINKFRKLYESRLLPKRRKF